MELNIAILPGDGVGQEITRQAKLVLQSIAKKYNHNFTYSENEIGGVAVKNSGINLPPETITACKKADAILVGSVGDPNFDNDDDPKKRPIEGLLSLRKQFDLFASIRPTVIYDNLIHKSPIKEKVIKDTDFIIYRELSSGIYFSKKSAISNHEKARDICDYSADEIDRIAELAFVKAQSRKKKLTLVDKANILDTSRLWRQRIEKMSHKFPNVKIEYLYVDNAAMNIIINPRQFDVILTNNLFGDILSDEASVICGSIGLMGSASIGKKTALFEPIHGSMYELKDKNIANPIAMISSVAMLLEHFKLFEEADLIKTAIDKSIELNIITPDLNPSSKFNTNDVGKFISEYIIDKKSILYHIENINLGQSTII